MLSFKELEKAFKEAYPKGNIYKVNSSKFEVVYKEVETLEYNGTSERVASLLVDVQSNDTKAYTYNVNNLLQLAKRLKLDNIVAKYDVQEEKEVDKEMEESFNDLMSLFA